MDEEAEVQKKIINSFNKYLTLLRGAGLVLGPRDMAVAKAQFLTAQKRMGRTSSVQVIATPGIGQRHI